MTSQKTSGQKKETRPETYLREIRDLQKQNNVLLKKLYGVEEDKVSSRRWSSAFKIAGMLLPYGFSMFVAWTFYAKVQDSIDTLKSFIWDIPTSITGNVQDDITSNIGSTIESVTEGGAVIWENKEDLYEQGKDKLNSYIIR